MIKDSKDLIIEFHILEVNTNFTEINWSVDKSQEELDIKGFNVYFSRTANDVLNKVNDVLIDDTLFVHKLPVGNFNKLKSGFYRIEAITSSDESYISESFDLFLDLDEWSQNVLDREMFSLMTTTPLSSLAALFYFRKYSGTKCTKCKTSDRTAQGNCPICFGTFWEGGLPC